MNVEGSSAQKPIHSTTRTQTQTIQIQTSQPDHQQFRMLHILPTFHDQTIHRRISKEEERELARTEAASWAQMTPLMAAIFGPLSILLGIPSLSQRWHGKLLDPPVLSNGFSNFASLPDPPLELVLSAVSLFIEILANTLLVLRFSNIHIRWTTWISYCFWIAKFAIDIANYIQFGISFPETEDIIYLEGFWVDLWTIMAQV